MMSTAPRTHRLQLLGVAFLLAGALGLIAFRMLGSEVGTTFPEAPFPIEHGRQALVDYSQTQSSDTGYGVVEPESTAAVAEAVAYAYAHGLPVRIRGHAHSMNHSSLPEPHELLLLTHKLDHYRLLEGETIRVGAGVRIHIVNRMLTAFGFALPVFNDGGLGPSVGGYIAAGGFGAGSEQWGGFWENVLDVTLVDGTGQVHQVSNDDEVFRWLFGSMGQLGVITEATLRFVRTDPAAEYPSATSGTVSDLPDTHPEVVAHRKDYGNPRYWFSLFVSAERVPEARMRLAEIQRRHQWAFHYLPMYEYRIETQRFNPPLLFPHEGPFHVVGIWGTLTTRAHAAVYALEADFMQLVQREPAFRRYIQSEVVAPDFDYADYFDANVYRAFSAHKNIYDPAGILNPGAVFRE